MIIEYSSRIFHSCGTIFHVTRGVVLILQTMIMSLLIHDEEVPSKEKNCN